MKIERVWAMPNHRTFEIKPIKNLIQEETKQSYIITDPFPFESKIDCFDYLENIKDKSIDLLLLDPPYTKRQVSEHYKKNGGKVTGWHTSSGWTAKVKDECSRVIKSNGKCISFGYNSCGLGKNREFEITRILLVCHGGDHYDTICTVETRSDHICGIDEVVAVR